MSDPSGHIAWWVAALIVVAFVAVVYATDYMLKNKWDFYENEDVSYSYYDSKRIYPDRIFHEQTSVIKVTRPSISKDKVGLGSISYTFITGGWEFKNLDLSLLDFGYAEASAEFSENRLYIGAFASVYSPSMSVNILGLNIEVSAEIGSVGASVDLGSGKIQAKGAYGIGLGISFSW